MYIFSEFNRRIKTREIKSNTVIKSHSNIYAVGIAMTSDISEDVSNLPKWPNYNRSIPKEKAKNVRDYF